MGLVITGSIETRTGGVYDSMYVRIENYIVHKYYGILKCGIRYYENKEAAEKAFPKYLNDKDIDPSGLLNVSMSFNGGPWEEKSVLFQTPLTREEFVTETTISSSFHMEDVQYIDFDEEGNEVVFTQPEMVEKKTELENGFTRDVYDLAVIGSGSIFDYAYPKLKEHFEQVFGEGNVNHQI